MITSGTTISDFGADGFSAVDDTRAIGARSVPAETPLPYAGIARLASKS
jgi:hypothetical protein